MMTILPVTDRASALEFLFGRINYERTATVPYRSYEFKLDRMRRLSEILGDPQHGVRTVHIAGTKGKGSTAHMTAAVLQKAGYRVGLYTSPHLEMLEERFLINGRQIAEGRLVELTARLQRAVAEHDAEAEREGSRGVTFFEVTSALAFLYFADERVDAAVIEVGLGGRLDSTNVCEPIVTAITSISFDHTKQLGNRLSSIAREKAGIIKPGVPIVSGVLDPEPRDVIRATAIERGAPLFEAQTDFLYSAVADESGTRMSYREPDGGYELNDVPLRFRGRHQAANGATATAVIRQLQRLDWNIPDQVLRDGLAEAFCPARIELIPGVCPTIIDAAHNVASVEALIATLEESFPGRPRQLVFAGSRDKDVAGMLRRLLPRFDEVIFTRFSNNPRATDAEQLCSLAERTVHEENISPVPRCSIAATPAEAWAIARGRAADMKLTVVAGSFFLAAELIPLIRDA